LLPETLEIHEVDGAFEHLEQWLRGHGFFAAGGESLSADLYVGFGCSTAIRRERTPGPPEPCPLPLLSCVVGLDNYHRQVGADDDGSDTRDDVADAGGDDVRVGEWERTWTVAEYAAAVETVRAAIARGDVYQVNLVQHLSAPFTGDPGAIAARLRPLTQPSSRLPFEDDHWRLLRGDGWAIVSATPELFLARRGDRLWTAPIKGTRPVGGSDELRASEKDAAEHVMIVDLERNDLSRVCVHGTVRWPELMAVRPMAGVEHMVSTVEGRLRPDVGLAELLTATFPGGSITGAPKIAAVDLIASLEPVGRGASMGAIGRVHGNGDLELALTIRTFAIAEGRIHLWVGGGVVWDSDAVAEVQESWTKADPLLAAIGTPSVARAAAAR
jgi:para-aminobenzoate synthetase component I